MDAQNIMYQLCLDILSENPKGQHSAFQFYPNPPEADKTWTVLDIEPEVSQEVAYFPEAKILLKYVCQPVLWKVVIIGKMNNKKI